MSVFFLQLCRFQSTLVIAEHNNVALNAVTQSSITAAKQIGGDSITVLVAGENCAAVSSNTFLSEQLETK